jgi:hypothetical protein
MGHLRFPCVLSLCAFPVQERSIHFDKHTNLIIYNDYSYNELLQVNSILVRTQNCVCAKTLVSFEKSRRNERLTQYFCEGASNRTFRICFLMESRAPSTNILSNA